MTTFQAIVTALVHSFTELLPLSSSTHHELLSFFIGWQKPEGFFLGNLMFGSFLALLIYFRHDWASLISSFLQVILFRKKPMTMDERLPFFILIALTPVTVVGFFTRDSIQALLTSPLWWGAAFCLFGFPLWISDSFSRRNKTMTDWTWLDALWVGVFQIASLIPGCGIQTALLTAAFTRNFQREAAARFAFFVATPMLGFSAYLNLRGIHFTDAGPSADMSWLSFGTAFVVTTLASLLVIGGFMKAIERKGFGRYFAYRTLILIMMGVMIWFRSRSE